VGDELSGPGARADPAGKPGGLDPGAGPDPGGGPGPDGEPGGLLPQSFFGRSSVAVAPDLLGCVLERRSPEGVVAVRLTEVEAYTGAADPASHAYRGPTRRNAVMFGPPGHAYVYFTYGMHFCVNLVCQPEGTAEAVLIRAGAIIKGVPLARLRRSAARTDYELARGPARLCQALAIDRVLDGADVGDPGSPLRVLGPAAGGSPGPGEPRPAGAIRTGPRVGVSAAAEVPWRFWIDGDPTVSVYRPALPRPRRKT
jgi:DNA-3-methyladenine glycosylase